MSSPSEGWEWSVYPSHTDEPLVAVGISSLEATSRLCVEDVMGQVDGAFCGVLMSPRGHWEICRRTKDGGLKWQDMYPGNWRVYSAPDAMAEGQPEK